MSVPQYLQDLANNYNLENPILMSTERVVKKLALQSATSEGNGFPGSRNDRLAVEFFRYQSQPWEALAQVHIQMVLGASQLFVEKLIEHITGSDQKTSSAILAEFVDPFFERKRIAMEDKVQEILHHYHKGIPQPIDSEFKEVMAKRFQRSLEKEVLLQALHSRPELFTKAAREKLTQPTRQPRNPSGFDAQQVIDQAEAYYEVCGFLIIVCV
jgi:hypothetical protein